MIKSLWHWMLEKGPLKTALIINGIAYVILAITMLILRWFTKHH